jgi:hypothetical protein
MNTQTVRLTFAYMLPPLAVLAACEFIVFRLAGISF